MIRGIKLGHITHVEQKDSSGPIIVITLAVAAFYLVHYYHNHQSRTLWPLTEFGIDTV